MKPIDIQWLGMIPYQQGLDAQSQIQTHIHQQKPETILGFEHPPVITFGKRGGTVLTKNTDIPIVHTNRGGLATAHEPGQLVIYPIIDLHRRKIKIRDWVYGIEEILITWLLDFQLVGVRDAKAGIWLDSKKLVSIGFQIQQGISTHGLAINISNDLHIFSFIEACGSPQTQPTSLKSHGIFSSPEESFLTLAIKLKEWIDSI